MILAQHARFRCACARLRRDTSGLALLEFAFSLPLVLMVGLFGVETANLALMNLRVSQLASNLADNASRVGVSSTLSVQQLREVDINDVLQATRIQGAGLLLTTNGRVTLSSLEEKDGKQRIHWQRCIGLKRGSGYDSSYGKTGITSGTDTTAANAGTVVDGMGETGAKVTAPPSSGVMFVEINYDYRPLIGDWLVKNGRIHYIASFIVRDRRDFSQLYNPNPAADRATCNLYAT